MNAAQSETISHGKSLLLVCYCMIISTVPSGLSVPYCRLSSEQRRPVEGFAELPGGAEASVSEVVLPWRGALV